MDERHSADYDLSSLDSQTAQRHLENAAAFIARVERALQEMGTNRD